MSTLDAKLNDFGAQLAVLGFVNVITGLSIRLPKIVLEGTDQAPASLWQFLPPKNKSG